MPLHNLPNSMSPIHYPRVIGDVAAEMSAQLSDPKTDIGYLVVHDTVDFSQLGESINPVLGRTPADEEAEHVSEKAWEKQTRTS